MNDRLLLGDSGRSDGRVLFVVAHTSDDMVIVRDCKTGART